jgi:hypothetical protein
VAANRKRSISLSITHMVGTQKEADLDIREPGHPTPDDGITGRGITGAIQVATEACKLCQTGFQRCPRGSFLAVTWSESIH